MYLSTKIHIWSGSTRFRHVLFYGQPCIYVSSSDLPLQLQTQASTSLSYTPRGHLIGLSTITRPKPSSPACSSQSSISKWLLHSSNVSSQKCGLPWFFLLTRLIQCICVDDLLYYQNEFWIHFHCPWSQPNDIFHLDSCITLPSKVSPSSLALIKTLTASHLPLWKPMLRKANNALYDYLPSGMMTTLDLSNPTF